MTGGGAFGTLAAAETMAEAGIEEPHARAIAAAIRDGRAGLAAKADLDALESRLRQPDCKPVHTFISRHSREGGNLYRRTNISKSSRDSRLRGNDEIKIPK